MLTTILTISGLMFALGVAGVLTRRNIIVIFMAIELILNAANLNFVAFSRHWVAAGGIAPHTGEVFAVFVMVVAAAEAAVGLGIVIALYRNQGTTSVDDIRLLKW
jgi:NADH-quinone oxidoreductase subunit K